MSNPVAIPPWRVQRKRRINSLDIPRPGTSLPLPPPHSPWAFALLSCWEPWLQRTIDSQSSTRMQSPSQSLVPSTNSTIERSRANIPRRINAQKPSWDKIKKLRAVSGNRRRALRSNYRSRQKDAPNYQRKGTKKHRSHPAHLFALFALLPNSTNSRLRHSNFQAPISKTHIKP
jgi:hypothetical protein